MGAVGVDVEELAVPVDAVDGRPLERLRRRVERLEHAERRELDLRDGETVRPLGEEVDERLHLRQLRHGPSLSSGSRTGRPGSRGLLLRGDGLPDLAGLLEHPQQAVPVRGREGRDRTRPPRARIGRVDRIGLDSTCSVGDRWRMQMASTLSGRASANSA